MTTKRPPTSHDAEAANLVTRSTIALMRQCDISPSPELSTAFAGIGAASALQAGATLDWWLQVAAAQWELAKRASGM